MNSSIGEKDILEGLRALGVEPGMNLEVHSSLKSFGHVEGGAEAVVAALMKATGEEGGVFMPALRLSPPCELTDADRRLGITCKLKILSPEEERSGMGAIADTFRRAPGVRVGEGVFRVSAWGKRSAEVASGFQWPLDNGGKGLLLGVDIYKLTAMHYVERLLPQKVKDAFKPSEEANALYPSGEWLVECGAPPVKAWHVIQREAMEKGLIKKGFIGSCACMFFTLKDVVGLYEKALADDPLGLYGLK